MIFRERSLKQRFRSVLFGARWVAAGRHTETARRMLELHSTSPGVGFAAVHIHRSEAGYRLGSDRGSPNHGSTFFSKRVMAEIRSPVSVRTWRPTP
jgi:hypothetical protein